MPIIAIYGSSMSQPDSQDYIAARELGRVLAENGYAVMSGGYAGIMGAVSQGAADAEGKVIGVTTTLLENLRGAEANQWLTEKIPYEKLSDRIIYLVTQADGYIVMPGGLGTLTELTLVWELIRTGDIPKRPIILYGEYWQQLIAPMRELPYFKADAWNLMQTAHAPQDVIQILQSGADSNDE